MTEEVELVDVESNIEDKSQIRLEVELESSGVPVFDIERPPVEPFEKVKTKYKSKSVKRKAKKSDRIPPEKPDIKRDEEMIDIINKIGIKRRRNFLLVLRKKCYNIYCKISRYFLNVVRKVKYRNYNKHVHHSHDLPSDIKSISLKDITDKDINDLGRKRLYKRNEDDTGNVINAVRNPKTGVVVMVPGSARDIKSQFSEDYEVVESVNK